MPDVSARRRVLAVALLLLLAAPLPAGVVPGDRYKLLLDGEEPKDLKKPPPKGIAVGTTAQDIRGEDLDGNKFKLSNYRGSVVLLVFWGHWCGPCRRMYPQSRTMVSRLADKPFVLLGVNSDKDRDAAKKAVIDEKLPWRSFWNDGGTNGSISTAWKINGWPTLFLIDHRGVIRQKWLGTQGAGVLDRAVDDLLTEVRGR